MLNHSISGDETRPLSQYTAPTLYSGSCRRKKQARTSSQWKVPLWVPIFFPVMLSVRGLLAWLDMYRESMRVKLEPTESKHQSDCAFNRCKTCTGLFVLMCFVKFNAVKHARHIQAALHPRCTSGGRIWWPDRMWRAYACVRAKRAWFFLYFVFFMVFFINSCTNNGVNYHLYEQKHVMISIKRVYMQIGKHLLRLQQTTRGRCRQWNKPHKSWNSCGCCVFLLGHNFNLSTIQINQQSENKWKNMYIFLIKTDTR